MPKKYIYRKSFYLYDPDKDKPFKLSRSKIELYIKCPRCFYYDRRLGISRPSMPGFALNSAVDELFKNEFDILRREKKPHELMKKYGIDAIPYSHPDLETWRYVFKGKQYHHKSTNFIVFGGVDDIWINKNKELIIVDYKSTSTQKEISLDDKWKDAYKRQMDVYQWLFKEDGYKVAKTGYFVYANGIKTNPKFDAKLEFTLQIIPYNPNTLWVEKALFDIKKCLDSNIIPKKGKDCEHCNYIEKRNNFS